MAHVRAARVRTRAPPVRPNVGARPSSRTDGTRQEEPARAGQYARTPSVYPVIARALRVLFRQSMISQNSPWNNLSSQGDEWVEAKLEMQLIELEQHRNGDFAVDARHDGLNDPMRGKLQIGAQRGKAHSAMGSGGWRTTQWSHGPS